MWSDMPVKQLDENFIEAFDMYMHDKAFHAQNHPRTYQPPEKRDDACRVPWHHPFQPVQRLAPQKPVFKQMYLTEDELDRFANTTYDTSNRNFTRDMFLFSCWTGILLL